MVESDAARREYAAARGRVDAATQAVADATEHLAAAVLAAEEAYRKKNEAAKLEAEAIRKQQVALRTKRANSKTGTRSVNRQAHAATKKVERAVGAELEAAAKEESQIKQRDALTFTTPIGFVEPLVIDRSGNQLAGRVWGGAVGAGYSIDAVFKTVEPGPPTREKPAEVKACAAVCTPEGPLKIKSIWDDKVVVFGADGEPTDISRDGPGRVTWLVLRVDHQPRRAGEQGMMPAASARDRAPKAMAYTGKAGQPARRTSPAKGSVVYNTSSQRKHGVRPASAVIAAVPGVKTHGRPEFLEDLEAQDGTSGKDTRVFCKVCNMDLPNEAQRVAKHCGATKHQQNKARRTEREAFTTAMVRPQAACMHARPPARVWCTCT